MRHYKLFLNSLLLISCFTALLSACGSSGKSSSATSGATGADSVSDFPLPLMPEELTDPEERASYLMLHYWDNVDFTSESTLADTLMLEQGFADFTTLFPHVTHETANQAIADLLNKAASASTSAEKRIMNIAEDYLYNSDSPIYNEDYFLLFINSALTRDPGDNLRLNQLKKEIERYAPGKKAPELLFTTASGEKKHLAGYIPTLLMFYQPDCERCHAAEEEMKANSRLKQALKDGMLRIVTVYYGSDTILWKKHVASMPTEWENGMDESGRIENEDLFHIRTTPTFFLINDKGIILERSVHPSFIERYL